MEKPQADRDRMKTLLAEAITTLCRNGLQYDEELTVEGLIGITLDKKEVFLVSVKESFVVPGKIKTDKSQAAESAEVSPRKARKRPSSSASDGASREKHRNTGDSDDDYSNDDDEQADLLDQNSRSSMGSTDHGGGGNRSRKKKDDVILIDPDLTIKEEILTQEGKQPSSRHHQSRSSDPRSRHPAAVQQEEPGLIFAEEVKQEHDPDLAEVFETSQEVIHMPQSMSTMTSGQPVPVSMVPSSSGFSGANVTIGAGAPDLSGLPIDWGSPSTSQDFSQAMSPSHQAPGFSGASQQRDEDRQPIVVESEDGTKRYMCPVCRKHAYSNKTNFYHHLRLEHRSARHLSCDKCGQSFSSQKGLSTHRGKSKCGLLDPNKLAKSLGLHFQSMSHNPILELRNVCSEKKRDDKSKRSTSQ